SAPIWPGWSHRYTRSTMRGDLATTSARVRPSVAAAVAILALAVGTCVGFPAAMAVVHVLHAPASPAPEAPATPTPSQAWLLVSTLGWCGAIAALATALAWPAAWALRNPNRHSRTAGALVLVPLLLPMYLAYAGWGLLRAPNSALGIGSF